MGAWLKAQASPIAAAIVGMVLLLLVGYIAIQYGELADARVALAVERRGRSDDRAAAAVNSASAVQAARREGERRYADLMENLKDEAARSAQATADADAAAAARGRLYGYVAKLAAYCGRAAGDPPAGTPGAPASAPGDLLAELQRRIGEAAGVIAAEADRTRRAGSTCERQYDSLMPKR